MSKLLLKQRNDHLFFQLRLFLYRPVPTPGRSFNLFVCGTFFPAKNGTLTFLPPGFQIGFSCHILDYHIRYEWTTQRINNEESLVDGKHGKTRRGHKRSICVLDFLGKNLSNFDFI